MHKQQELMKNVVLRAAASTTLMAVVITVVGAGPIGLTCAFWAGMREASVRLIDTLPEIGGQVTAAAAALTAAAAGGQPAAALAPPAVRASTVPGLTGGWR